MDKNTIIVEIKKVLTFLGEYNGKIYALKDEIPTIPGDNKDQETKEFFFDPHDEKSSYYAYDESHHNGDHYNCAFAKCEIPISALERMYKKYYQKARDKADVIAEQEMRDRRINEILNKNKIMKL